MQLGPRMKAHSGFTLIEVVIVILVIGVIASVAMRNLGSTIETAHYEQTKHELDALAIAIAGDPMAYASGTRASFGYVGDIGTLPSNLDALVSNPGGYATWKGPYIETGKTSDDFKQDAWGAGYLYSDTLIRSTGSGGSIDKLIASSTADLLANSVQGVIMDASMGAPGQYNKDSVVIQLIRPNGTGGLQVDSTYPAASGAFSFSGIPVGHHTVRAIHKPATDTCTIPITVYPRQTTKLSIVFPADIF